MALFEARSLYLVVPHATQTFGLCAVGFAQVKAAGLVRAFDPRLAAKSLGVRFGEDAKFCVSTGAGGVSWTGKWNRVLVSIFRKKEKFL